MLVVWRFGLTPDQLRLEAAEAREVDGACLRLWFRRRPGCNLGPLCSGPQELAG